MRRGIDVAVTQIGVAEASHRNDGIPAERYLRGEKLPWCAAFCLWCNGQSDEEAAAPTNADWYAMRSVQTFEDRMKARGFWRAPGAAPPARGDYVFFASRGGSDHAAGGRHMGLVEELVGAMLHTVEGNLSDKVSREVHDLTSPAVKARITGYATIPIRKGN